VTAARSRVREGAYTLVFMLAVTVVFISATSAMHLATKERIERNMRSHVQRSVLLAAGLAPPTGADEVGAAFAAAATEHATPDGTTYYVVAREGGGRAFVLLREGAGLWGAIGAAVGLDAALDGTMTGLSFTYQNETPGLGARIDEPWFVRQFAGKRGPFTTRAEGERTAPNEFDAITGATITSAAVRDLVNRAIADAPAVTAGAKD